MTPAEELRMFELEAAIEQSKNKIEFLVRCIDDYPVKDTKNGSFIHAYPEMTADFLDHLRDLVPDREYCIHSKTDPGCSSCQDRNARFKRHTELLLAVYGAEDI